MQYCPHSDLIDNDPRQHVVHEFVLLPPLLLQGLGSAAQAAGKHLALMAHYNHWCELEPAIAREAVRRVRATGAMIRAQGPLLAHINDSPEVWARLWQTQVELGITPYYMFVERDTGAIKSDLVAQRT